jgi:hypothetical protein
VVEVTGPACANDDALTVCNVSLQVQARKIVALSAKRASESAIAWMVAGVLMPRHGVIRVS